MTDGLFLEPDSGAGLPDQTAPTGQVPAADQAPASVADPAVDPAKPFQCDICGSDFTRKDRLNTHRKAKHPGAAPLPPGRVGRPPADKPPGNVQIIMPGGKSPKGGDLAKVEERAREMVTTVAALVLMMGQHDDAADLAAGAGPWAASVRELAEHEEWLRKLMLSSNDASRMMAWMGFAMATGGLAMPLMIRHNLLPDNLAELAASMFVNAAPGDAPAA